MVQLISHHTEYRPIPPTTLAFFQSIPQWPILASRFFDSPALQPFHIEPLSLGTDRQFTLVTKTLATPSTFRAWQGFWVRPTPSSPYGEFVNVLAIGADLNGHLDTLHGGIIGVLLDEVSGQVAYCHRDLDRIGLTMSMNIDFKRPVKTPGLVVLRAWLDKATDGRNMYIRASVEDIHGGLYAAAESVFREVSMEKFEGQTKASL